MKQGTQQAVQEVERKTSNRIRERENIRADFFFRLRKANRVSERIGIVVALKVSFLCLSPAPVLLVSRHFFSST